MRKNINTSRRSFLKLGIGASLAGTGYFSISEAIKNYSKHKNKDKSWSEKQNSLEFSWLVEAERAAFAEKRALLIPPNSIIPLDNFFESRVPIQSVDSVLRAINPVAQIIFTGNGIKGTMSGIKFDGGSQANAPVFKFVKDWNIQDIIFENFTNSLLIESCKKTLFNQVTISNSISGNQIAVNNGVRIGFKKCFFDNPLGGAMQIHGSKNVSIEQNDFFVSKAAVFLGAGVSGTVKNNHINSISTEYGEKIFSTEFSRNLIVQKNVIIFSSEV